MKSKWLYKNNHNVGLFKDRRREKKHPKLHERLKKYSMEDESLPKSENTSHSQEKYRETKMSKNRYFFQKMSQYACEFAVIFFGNYGWHFNEPHSGLNSREKVQKYLNI